MNKKLAKEIYDDGYVEGYKDACKEFLAFLRDLHDYTFINVTDANKVIYLRDNIEEGLKKYDEMLTSSPGGKF